ncbi:hypothetical protein Ahy_B05g074947 [Arachis hypogaea]|uniref:Uncharacterized protein n=1 Tax=Arachis hypogaea TaxID=3818 RepID=A0A444Z083_ARAHY|nr:hypothetical protein Ahy_B05g074947 [Arachis hypogaea]
MLRKIFDHRMVRWLQQMMQDVHERRDHLTIWLRPDIKKVLYVHWEINDGFRNHLLTNRANRVSARSSNYTDGSATFIKTMAMLIVMAETFKYTHTLKENKERFSPTRRDWRPQANNLCTLERTATTPLIQSSILIWLAVQELRLLVGLGSFFANNFPTSTLRASFASATSPVEAEDNVNLRELQAQQLQQSKERYNEILARVSDTYSIKLELRQELEQIQRI